MYSWELIPYSLCVATHNSRRIIETKYVYQYPGNRYDAIWTIAQICRKIRPPTLFIRTRKAHLSFDCVDEWNGENAVACLRSVSRGLTLFQVIRITTMWFDVKSCFLIDLQQEKLLFALSAAIPYTFIRFPHMRCLVELNRAGWINYEQEINVRSNQVMMPIYLTSLCCRHA